MRVNFILFVAVIVSGCVSQLDPIVYPDIDGEWSNVSAISFETRQQDIITGTYIVDKGQTHFGGEVAVRFDGDRITMYAVRNVTFVFGYGGIVNSSAYFVATWRAITGPLAGRLELRVPSNEGGQELLDSKGAGKGLVLLGHLTTNGVQQEIRLVKKGALKSRIRGFQIIAHRGGGRNSERLGRSENSIPMILLASRLGATGIEIDVQMTKDRIPIVFHDDTFTARTVPSPYVIGSVENYTLAQMRVAAILVNGEQIPTLREVLLAVIDRTNLSLVWLDVKQPLVVDSILAIQMEMIEYAATKRRNIRIFFGIYDEDVLRAYEKSPLVGKTPILSELSVEETRRIQAGVWAPRFTLGIQQDIVKEMQREGREVYVWTLDDESFIRQYLQADVFDGVLTNYPSLLAAIFYTQAGP